MSLFCSKPLKTWWVSITQRITIRMLLSTLHDLTQLSYLLFAATAKLLQSCPTLCDSIDGSPPGSPIPGILQARTLEWVAISLSNTWKWKVKVKSQSCPTLRNPKDCSLPGSSAHGIFQARVLEWGAIAFSAFLKQKQKQLFVISSFQFPKNLLLVVCL